jgi:hypothetical protein
LNHFLRTAINSMSIPQLCITQTPPIFSFSTLAPPCFENINVRYDVLPPDMGWEKAGRRMKFGATQINVPSSNGVFSQRLQPSACSRKTASPRVCEAGRYLRVEGIPESMAVAESMPSLLSYISVPGYLFRARKTLSVQSTLTLKPVSPGCLWMVLAEISRTQRSFLILHSGICFFHQNATGTIP